MKATTSNMRIRIFAGCIILACFLVASAACDKPRPALKITNGQILQPMAVQDLQGNATSLSLASGKVLILNIWATWCGPCRHELPSLDRLAAMLDPTHYKVLGLSVDSDPYVVREFLNDRKIQFVTYMDSTRQVSNEVIGVRVFPSTLIISADGRLLEVVEGWRDWDDPQLVSKIRALAG